MNGDIFANLRLENGHIPRDPVSWWEAGMRDASMLLQEGIAWHGSEFLDFGCGPGRLAPHMAFCNYVGLDVNPDSISFAQSRLPGTFYLSEANNGAYNPKGVRTSVAMPFLSDSFDGLAAYSVFTHLGLFTEARHYLCECARVLRTGSKALITFFRSPPNEPSLDPSRTVYPLSDVYTLLETSGFDVLRTFGGLSGTYDDQMHFLLCLV